jgi:ABC-type transport system involved in multi-copper enzyme maturation permease subunit
MFSFVLAMTAAFLGAPAIAADLESGVAHAMLARPIRRADLVIGRWLGLVVVVIAYAIASGALEIAAVRVVAGYAPPNAPEAIAYLAAEAVAVLTLALALGTRIPAMASGAICVVVFGLGWMAGVFTGVGRFFDAAPLVAVADAVRWILPTDGLWRGAIHGLEPPVLVLVALGRGGSAAEVNPFFVSQPPETAFVIWSIAWVALVLGAAVVSLERRDL